MFVSSQAMLAFLDCDIQWVHRAYGEESQRWVNLRGTSSVKVTPALANGPRV